MRMLIYGVGRSGLAAGLLCLRQGHEVSFFERREEGADISALEEAGARRVTNPGDVPVDICIAAPGVPIDHPDLDNLRGRNVEVIGEVEWVYRNVPGEYIGITGTAGKGTVTRWLADTLGGAGRNAVAGGNIDPALASVAEPGATHVVELSSFQLERCPTLRPRIAVILNLGSDHLDRHGDVATYHAAKRNLLQNLQPEDLFIYNADDPILSGWAQETTARTAGFSLKGPADAHLQADGTLTLHGEALLESSQLRVRGAHHLANGLAVALAASDLGLTGDEIAAGLTAFGGLPGRYALAGRIGNVEFIEDSIATRPLAVAAALAATPAPVAWIAGGHSKGADVRELEGLIREKVALFVGIGESGRALHDTVSEWVPAVLCPHVDGGAALRCAVHSAFNHLQAHHQLGGTVLLAPLAASFDQFADYRERAQRFRDAVREEELSWTLS